MKRKDANTVEPWNSPITAEGLLPMFMGLTESFIRSISCSWRLRSRAAFSFASFRAVSKALTRSAVARSRFSILGSSPRRSALSLSSYGAEPGLRTVLRTMMMEQVRVKMASYLFVSLSQLLQVVLQKADLLSLAAAVVCVLWVHVRVLQTPQAHQLHLLIHLSSSHWWRRLDWWWSGFQAVYIKYILLYF